MPLQGAAVRFLARRVLGNVAGQSAQKAVRFRQRPSGEVESIGLDLGPVEATLEPPATMDSLGDLP